MIRKTSSLLAIALLSAFAVTAARADGMPLGDVRISVGSGGATPYEIDASNDEEYGVAWDEGMQAWHLWGTYDSPGYGLGWNFHVDPDPAVFGNFAITNNTPGGPSDFLIGVALVAAIPDGVCGVTTDGGISGTLNDTSGLGFPPVGVPGDGALLTTDSAGRPVYRAVVNGIITTVATLLPPPGGFYSTSVDPGEQPQNWENGSPAAFGPMNNFYTPDIASIGILHAFALSEGDSTTVTSRFQAQTCIPEPASIALLALGGLVAIRRRK